TLDRDEHAQLTQRIIAKVGKYQPDAYTTDTVTKALPHARATAKRLGISTDGARLDDVRIHDLRRTLGSWQARTGASLAIIGKSLGHQSQQATEGYAPL